MVRKVTFILFLIGLLVAFFYFRPLIYKTEARPTLLDRMPEGDFLGKMYLLDVARESTSMLYHNKIPFRDLFSPEFLLAQGKSYGIDLQKPALFFANDTGEWGALIHVNDSSKIYSGIVRLQKNIDLKDTMVGQQKVYTFKGKQAYITYGNDWIFLYKGKNLPKRMYHVVYSKKGDTSIAWKAFEKEKQYKHERLVIYSNYERLKRKGIITAIFAHDSDSTHIKLKSYIRSDIPLSVSPKDSGLAFIHQAGTTGKLLNLHLNVEKLRNAKEDPYYKTLAGISRRVSFPLNSFLQAWEGDLSYHQGGTIAVKEKIIESVLDEDFNVTEVVKMQEKQVPAFALLFSINNKIHDLLYQLFVKGILRKEGDKLRFLFSPAIKMKLTPNVVYFYSSDQVPQTIYSSHNGGLWNYKGAKLEFKLDSMNRTESFGSIRIPVTGILKMKRNLF